MIRDSRESIIYQTSPSGLAHTVQQNPGRFPEDFAFKLTKEEWARLQRLTEKRLGMIRPYRYLPYGFTKSERKAPTVRSGMDSERSGLERAPRARFVSKRATAKGFVMAANFVRNKLALKAQLSFIRCFSQPDGIHGQLPVEGALKRIMEAHERLTASLPWPKKMEPGN